MLDELSAIILFLSFVIVITQKNKMPGYQDYYSPTVSADPQKDE